MDENNINQLIDTSKQGINYYLSQILIKGYQIMLMIDKQGIVRLKYINNDNNSATLSGSSCSDVISQLYMKVIK